MKNTVFILFFVLYLPSCVIEQGNTFFDRPSVNECTFSVDPLTGLPIRWEKNRFPVSFYVHESVPMEAYYNFVSALNYWNFVWLEYLEERGIDAPPLFNIVGENELFSASPKRDGYNVLFFTNDFNRYYGEQSPEKTQAVTIVRRAKSDIKDADIIVNNGHFRFFYDRSYNEDIRFLASQKKDSIRNLASSKDLSLIERVKLKIFSFFKGLLKLLRREVSTKRDIAAREVRVPRGYVDFPSLMIHELGHVPGLFHSDAETTRFSRNSPRRSSSSSRGRERSVQSVMKVKLPSGSSRRNIGDFDLDNLFCGYYGRY